MRVTHWLLLAIVAAAEAVTAENLALLQLEEALVALLPRGHSRHLVPGDLFEAHAARYLLAAADASKEVVALFRLYKKLYPERVAAYGSTEATQLAYFEEHVFPRIQEKADELLATSKDGTSTGSGEDGTDATAQKKEESDSSTAETSQTSGGTAGTNGGTSTGGATPSGTNGEGGTTSGGPASSTGGGTGASGGPTSGGTSTSGGSPASRTPSGGTPSSGTPSSGTPSSGTPSSGTPSSGTPSSGTPSSGTPSSGTPSSGTPSSGTPSSGTPSSGTPSSGTPSSGTPSSGTPSSGTPSSGTPSSGTPTSGTPTSGTPSSGTPSSGTSTSGTSTSSTPSSGTSTSTSLTATSVSPSTTTSSGSSFWSTTYNPTLSANVNSLQSQTNNVETVVQSSSSSSSSSATPTSAYTSPTVIKGYTSPSRRRFLSTTSTVDTSNVDVLFCDVEGNAIWKWSAEEVPDATVTNSSNSTTAIDVDVDGVCSATTTLTVSAYQTGCSLQNHPEGCDNVYYKGCGGITVSPTSERIVIARTGGRTLGVLNYKHVDEACQGQVVDAIATYRGKKFNSPTYAEYASNGILYFTDSPFGLATSAADFDGDTLDKSPLRELPFNGVYMLPTGANQSVELVDCDMTRPNKIAFSPASDVMYITNSQKHNSYVKQYALAADGTVRNASIFFNFTAHPELETADGYAKGIKVDANGYVYVVCYKGVYIFSPDAEMAGAIMSSEELDSVTLGLGRLFLSGAFGLVAQTSGVPSQSLPQAHVTCQA